jgi:O-methyltransferase
MYESTVDVLYHMYEKLSIGGFVIMDDWNGFPSKTAVEDFFKVHGMDEKIIAIDALSAYWKKQKEVKVEFWRYQQSMFTA